MATVAQPVANSIRSRIVTTAVVPLRERLQKAQTTWGVRALQVAAFAATLIPVIGLGVTYLVDRQKNSVVADNQKEVLAKYYRKQVAAQLGIDPGKVTKKDLELAKGNHLIKQAVAKVEDERSSANRAAAFSLAGAATLSSFVPLPGAGTVAHTASKLAVDGAGAIAGGMVSSLFDKDILPTHDVMMYLDEKRASGQRITARDIAILRISQSPKQQEELKKANGIAFHKMNEGQQDIVLVNMPGMEDAAAVAERINNGIITDLGDVLMAAPKQTWAKKVGGPRGARGSFVNQVNERRAAAAQATGPTV